MGVAAALRGTMVFVGCGFAAKYRLGGGNFSVPLQWMLHERHHGDRAGGAGPGRGAGGTRPA